jgi:hypothetical protein
MLLLLAVVRAALLQPVSLPQADPCTKEDPLEACAREKAQFAREKAECEVDVEKLENQTKLERATLRKDWTDVTNETANVSADIESKEAELKSIEAVNNRLHEDLIANVGGIGLLQANNTTAEEWLACIDERRALELAAAQCTARRSAEITRASAQREHYQSLHDAATQKKAMADSREGLVDTLLSNARSREARLANRLEQVKVVNESSVVSSLRAVSDVKASARSVSDGGACDATSCFLEAETQGLSFATQVTSSGAPAGCVKYNDGRIVFVETCENHENCQSLDCNGCSVLCGTDTLLSITDGGACEAASCEKEAEDLGLSFATSTTSDGAPAGCVQVNETVVFAEQCSNADCSTTCTDCSVLCSSTTSFVTRGRFLWRGK